MLAHRIFPLLNVSDIQASLAWFEKLTWKKGFDWGKPLTALPWGVRETYVRHPDGHVFRVRQDARKAKTAPEHS